MVRFIQQSNRKWISVILGLVKNSKEHPCHTGHQWCLLQHWISRVKCCQSEAKKWFDLKVWGTHHIYTLTWANSTQGHLSQRACWCSKRSSGLVSQGAVFLTDLEVVIGVLLENNWLSARSSTKVYLGQQRCSEFILIGLWWISVRSALVFRVVEDWFGWNRAFWRWIRTRRWWIGWPPCWEISLARDSLVYSSVSSSRRSFIAGQSCSVSGTCRSFIAGSCRGRVTRTCGVSRGSM